MENRNKMINLSGSTSTMRLGFVMYVAAVLCFTVCAGICYAAGDPIQTVNNLSNFIFSLSDRNAKINSYIAKLSSDVNLVDYQFDEGTSPEKVTEPIAKKGVNTLLMETSITDPLMQKQQTADNLIKSLDELIP